MSDKGWVQFLLVAVPVMSLVGSWLALRTVDRLRGRRGPQAGESERQSDTAGSKSDRS